MCVAIVKAQNLRLTRQCLLNCYTANRDGAGFAYVKDGEVCIQKGFFTFDKFWEAFQEFQDLPALVHFRIATTRAINGKNCHPWRVNDDLVFIHNGMISNCSKDDDISDTGNFNKYVLQPLMEESPEFWKTSQFKWLVEAAIGKGNKLAFLDSKGEFKIFNEDQGYWDSGVWFSNKSYTGYSSSRDFYVLQEDEEKAKESKAARQTSVSFSSSTTEETGEVSSHLTNVEKTIREQKRQDIPEGVIVINSLEELDAKLEELNGATV